MHVNVGECRERGTEKTPTNPGTEEPQGRGLELGAYYSGGPSGSFCIDGFFHSISAVTPYLCHRKTFLIHEKRVLTQLCSRVIRMPSLRGARRKEGTNESALRGTGEPPPITFPVFSSSAVTCGFEVHYTTFHAHRRQKHRSFSLPPPPLSTDQFPVLIEYLKVRVMKSE